MSKAAKKVRVLVCDDIEARATNWKEKLRAKLGSRAVVESLAAEKLEAELQNVAKALRAAIDSSTPKGKTTLTKFDSVDIVLVDNNLVRLFENQAVTTAETFVGQIIACCKCSFVAVLNRQPDVAFELQLKRDSQSKADLSIRAADLLQDGLWLKDWDTFRPWYWPFLLGVRDRRQAQLRSLRGHLDDKILDFFGFDVAARELLDEALGKIFPQGISKDPTFREFFTHHARSLAPENRAKLKGSDEIVARVVTSELSGWLHYDVLMRQEILTDAPHLALNSALLLKQLAQLPKLKPATQIDKVTEMVSKITLYKKAKFKKEAWLDRPAWWASRLDENGALSAALLSALATPDPTERIVFCEDASRFAAAVDARPYHLSHHSLNGTRYIWNRNAPKYVPRSDLMK